MSFLSINRKRTKKPKLLKHFMKKYNSVTIKNQLKTYNKGPKSLLLY